MNLNEKYTLDDFLINFCLSRDNLQENKISYVFSNVNKHIISNNFRNTFDHSFSKIIDIQKLDYKDITDFNRIHIILNGEEVVKGNNQKNYEINYYNMIDKIKILINNNNELLIKIKLVLYQVIATHTTKIIYDKLNIINLDNFNLITQNDNYKIYDLENESGLLYNINIHNGTISIIVSNIWKIKYLNEKIGNISCIIHLDYISNSVEINYDIEFKNNHLKKIFLNFIPKYIHTMKNSEKSSYSSKEKIKSLPLRSILDKLVKKSNDIDFDIFYNKMENLVFQTNFVKYLKKEYELNSNFKLPIRNKNNVKKSDFLIINFDEENKKYNNEDCMPIILKVINEMPSFIIISTQENSIFGINTHYQHILSENLKLINYKLLIKDKINNIRSRIYYFTEKVSLIEEKKEPFSSKINNNKLITENIRFSSISKSNINRDLFYIEKYGIERSNDQKYGKGLLFLRLEILKNGKPIKFIFINYNLEYNKSKKDNGLEIRKKQFENIINDMKLIDYQKNGYNIFFNGYLNFRLIGVSKNIIKEYAKKKNIDEKHNELYIFLKSVNEENLHKLSFYQKLLNSIDTLGIHLTYKYTNNLEKQYDFFRKIMNEMKDKHDNIYLFLKLNIDLIQNNVNLLKEYYKIYILLILRLYKNEYIQKLEQWVIILNLKRIFDNETALNIFKNFGAVLKYKYFQNIIDHLDEYYKNIRISNISKCQRYYIENMSQSDEKKNCDNLLINIYINVLKMKYTSNKKINIKEINIEKENIINSKYYNDINEECKLFLESLFKKININNFEENDKKLFANFKINSIINKYNEIFIVKNKNNYPIIPSQPTRIIYALAENSNINTTSFDFNVYLFPNKSSNKLISLSFEIKNSVRVHFGNNQYIDQNKYSDSNNSSNNEYFNAKNNNEYFNAENNNEYFNAKNNNEYFNAKNTMN